MSLHAGLFRSTSSLRALYLTNNCFTTTRTQLLIPVRTKVTLEQSVGLPPKPKRPLTPYFRFLKQIRPSIVEQNPKASITDVTKIVAERWNKIDAQLKEQLENDFKQEQEKYVNEKLQYDSTLTQQDREKLTLARQEKAISKEKKELRKKRKEFKKPKKNPSAFVLWMQTQFENRGDKPFRTFQLQTAEKWRSMSDTEKRPFFDKAKELGEKYLEEIALWEEKMIRLGNTDIIRTESLIEPKSKKVAERMPKVQK